VASFIIKSAAEFGIIEKSMVFDDVNQPNILKTRAQQFFNNQKSSRNGFELTPLDLSLNNLDAESIIRGDRYNVENPILSIKEPLQVIKKDINIVNPLDIKVTIGDKFKTLTQYQNEINRGLQRIDELQQSLSNQTQAIGNLKAQIKNVNNVVDAINLQVDEADLPALNDAVRDLNNAIIDLNDVVEGIPSYGIATPTQTGLMSMYDKEKLDSLEKYEEATPVKSGLFSAQDKRKLDLINITQAIDLDDLMQRVTDLESQLPQDPPQ